MKKKYIVPNMRAKKLNMGRCLDSISGGKVGTRGEDSGAKSSTVSFDDWDDSKD